MNRTVMAGVALAAATAVISGFAVFLNSFAVREMNDAAVFTTLKNGLAAGVLLALAAVGGRGSRRVPRDKGTVFGLLVVGVLGGGVAFLMFFTGLSLASAPSAAFIHKTLFVWVALMAVPLLGERLGPVQIVAMLGLLVSQLLIVPPVGLGWGVGETLIAGATLLWAVEVVIARRLLATVTPSTLGIARLGIGLVVLIGFVTLSGKLPAILALTGTQWSWVVVTGFFLAGYVATWMAALSRAPATLVTSVLVLGAPITALLDAAVRGTLPAAPALAGHVLIVAAVALMFAGLARRPRAVLKTVPA